MLDESRLHELGTFRAAAANEPGQDVVGTVFEHPDVADDVTPGGEIAELRWLDPATDLPGDLAPCSRSRSSPSSQRNALEPRHPSRTARPTRDKLSLYR